MTLAYELERLRVALEAKWCEACATDCPDKGKDLLCICGRFKKESEAKG